MNVKDTLKWALDTVLSKILSSGSSTPQKPRSLFYPRAVAGEYPQQINKVVAERLARAYMSAHVPTKVAIGRDSRPSSQQLATALAHTLLSHGVDVVELGLTTTPFTAWVAREKNIDAVMVTCPRNESAWNGFQFYSGTSGEPLTLETGLGEFKDRFMANAASLPHTGAQGVVTHHREFEGEYKKNLIEAATGSPRKKKLPKKLRIAVDYSSGTTSTVMNSVLRTLGVSFSTINEQPSGTFPGHGPNPLVERSWEGISHLVKKGRYHCGVVFDAAGERVAFFDEQGRHIPSAQMGALLAKFYLPRADHWRNGVVTSEMSSVVTTAAEEAGGRTYTASPAYIDIAQHMREHRAILGVSREGRYFFKDFDYWDGAAFTVAKVLRILAAQDRTQVSELVEPFGGRVALPPIRIPYQEGTEKAVLQALRRHFRGETTTAGGLTVRFKSWWFTIRRQHLPPVWVLSLEGEEREQLERKRREIEAIVKNVDELTPNE